VLLPSLPPRRQSCRRNVCRAAVGRDYFILLPFRPARKLRRAAYEVTITGRQAAAEDLLASAPRCFPSRKKGKAQLSRANIRLARCEVARFPSCFRLNPVSLFSGPGALPGGRRPVHLPPSLGAQYRALWKTCQEKFTQEPQNIMLSVSKASICSGTCAKSQSYYFSRSRLSPRFPILRPQDSHSCLRLLLSLPISS